LTAFSQASIIVNRHQDTLKLSYCQAQQIAVDLTKCDSITMELVQVQSDVQIYKHQLELKNKIINDNILTIGKLKQNVLAEQDKTNIFSGLLAKEQKRNANLVRGVKVLGGTSALLAVGLLVSLLKH